jgi:thermitase
MGFFANTRSDARQVCVLAVALLWAILLLSLAPGAKGEAAAQPKVDEDPSGAPYVAGELLVAYEPGTSAQTEQALVRGSGGRTAEDLPGNMKLVSFPGIAQEKSREARERALQRKLERLRDEPGVEAADYNHIYTATSYPDDPRFGSQWGLKRTAFPGAWIDARGTGARIAVVDSGINKNHLDLSAKVAEQRSFVADGAGIKDRFGHGTHVAGIAAALTHNGRGVAGGCPACKLLIARVLDATGNTNSARLVKGINWSANNNADVINISIAGPDNDAVKMAVNDARANGTVVVAAAGNERTTARRYPAAYRKVIAVSATNENDGLARFSSHGNWVDLAAPGTNILSTGAGGGYYEDSGTSEAAPFVSALAGLLASRGKTASEIRQRMQSTATDLGASGDDPKFGHGRINADKALPP